MSGGSFNYKYTTFKYDYAGRMLDAELDEMMEDLSKVLRDLEWYTDGDIGEDTYRETILDFKRKWFKRSEADIKKMIEEQFNKTKQELLSTLKYTIDE